MPSGRAVRSVLLGAWAVAALAMTAPASAAVVLTNAYTAPPTDPVGAATYVTAPPGDTTRLFVVERPGRVRVAVDGAMADTPFLDITALVDTEGEGALSSIAFAPDYATSGLLYVDYVAKPDDATPYGDIRIVEYRRSAADPNVADPKSSRLVLEIDHHDYWHFGGTIKFGADGFLYIGVGDGGGVGDPAGNGQSTKTLLGKLLRIDPRAAGTAPYTVPDTNPFAGPGVAPCDPPGGTSDCPEIVAYGLRNPFRWSFDRTTGDVLIGDVGQSLWEEVDFLPASDVLKGLNFGWNCWEGLAAFSSCTAASYLPPVFTYKHTGPPAAIIGGVVVRDPALADLAGRYLYTDHFAHEIDSLLVTSAGAADGRVEVNGSEATPLGHVSGFGEDAAGHVYVASLDGQVYRLVSPAPDAPPVSIDAAPADQAQQQPDGPAPAAAVPAASQAALLSVRGSHVQDLPRGDRLSLAVLCREACRVRVTAVLGTGGGGRRYALRGKVLRLRADTRVRLGLAVSRYVQAALERALARGRRVLVTVRVRARDAGGQVDTIRLVVRIKPPRRP
jgi:glucose/arabinose dehydrogenase